MAVERKWLAVPATNFTVDGTRLGIVTITDTNGFKVKGYAFVAATGLPVLQLQIQRVLSPTQLIVGPLGTSPNPNNYTDISAYTVLLGASIGFPEQDKNKIKPDDIEQAVYEADPTVATRVIPVDPYGRLYGPDYPMPVNPSGGGTIPTTWTEIDLSYDSNNDLTEVQYKENSTVERTLILSYDSNGNLTKVVAS